MKPLIKLKTLQRIHTCYHTNRLTFGGKKKNVNVIGERWEKKEKKINPMHPSMPSLRIHSAQPLDWLPFSLKFTTDLLFIFSVLILNDSSQLTVPDISKIYLVSHLLVNCTFEKLFSKQETSQWHPQLLIVVHHNLKNYRKQTIIGYLWSTFHTILVANVEGKILKFSNLT